jgi:hypothetical protein
LRILLESVPQHGSCRDARWAGQALTQWESGQPFDSIEHTPWEPR